MAFLVRRSCSRVYIFQLVTLMRAPHPILFWRSIFCIGVFGHVPISVDFNDFQIAREFYLRRSILFYFTLCSFLELVFRTLLLGSFYRIPAISPPQQLSCVLTSRAQSVFLDDCRGWHSCIGVPSRSISIEYLYRRSLWPCYGIPVTAFFLWRLRIFIAFSLWFSSSSACSFQR